MEGGEERVALLNHHKSSKEEEKEKGLWNRVCDESKKLWVIVGPAIFTRVVTFSMDIITQSFAGHLGDLELAAISIAVTVVIGFNFGLLVRLVTSINKFYMLSVFILCI
jgi:multidrug resistance protein, MATE family